MDDYNESFDPIYSMNNRQKLALLKKIGRKPSQSSDFEYWNALMRNDCLVDKCFDERNLTYYGINEFIDNIVNPYYEEGIPNEGVEDYDAEIKKLERMRDENNERIKELQEEKAYEDAFQEEQKVNDDMITCI